MHIFLFFLYIYILYNLYILYISYILYIFYILYISECTQKEMSLAQEEEYVSNTPLQYAIHGLWRERKY